MRNINTKKKFLVSLVIPVYNTAYYLAKALQSVQDQTFRDFQAIIINDGSTDESLQIIERFAIKNKNFRIINQKNKGLSATRNRGIKASNSEFITFMDSDDFIEPDYLEELYNTAIKYQADIVCCNFCFYYPQMKIKVKWPFPALPGVYSNERALKKITSCIGIFNFVWNKIFRKELFTKNNIKFSNMHYEDCAISPVLFFYAKKVAIIPNVLYNYVMRSSSITHAISASKINDSIRAIKIIRDFYENKGILLKFRRRLKGHAKRFGVISCYNVFMMHLRSKNFKGFLKNIHSVRRSIKSIIFDKVRDYNKKNDILKGSYLVIDPEKK
ncbi:MAG: glycosyltransferase [Candidatus Improbicoccus devescovinae]|nr:MAG: glycosyltransferase [Candidatus Improbicoccus devescovinae]